MRYPEDRLAELEHELDILAAKLGTERERAEKAEFTIECQFDRLTMSEQRETSLTQERDALAAEAKALREALEKICNLRSVWSHSADAANEAIEIARSALAASTTAGESTI